MKKFLNLLNIKTWFETFLLKTVVTKGSKHAVTAIVGLLGSAIFTAKVKPILDQFGISIDSVRLAEGLTVAFGAAAGWLMNWGVHVIENREIGGLD